jgi:hypothetical protein
MTISADEASATLAEIDGVVARVKQSRIYQTTSLTLFLWGATVIVGNVVAMVTPHWAAWTWLAIDACAAIATIVIIHRTSDPSARLALRFLAAFVLFFIFGWIWSEEIGHFGPRQLDAFWPTLFLSCYAIAGLAFGLVFTALGLGLTALILIGYFWSGEYFSLWLAVVNGGGFILCGVLMRRA